MRDKITSLIISLDAKYRRVQSSYLVDLSSTLSSLEILDGLREQIAKRSKGRYEFTGVYDPSLDDIEWPCDDLDDDQLEAAYAEFDKILTELVGLETRWLIPVSDERFSNESCALVLSGA